MDANDFENVANCDDFDFNTKTLHKILCHVVNGNPPPDNFKIEKHDGTRVVNGKIPTAIFNNTTNWYHCPHCK